MDNRPIGIFDSGLGGLTVLKEMLRFLPGESMVYFGDCARVPYGTKSRETVTKYAFQDVRFLLSYDVKLVVVACNTASACSIDELKRNFDIPVLDVVRPGAIEAVRATVRKKIGIIGTQATIVSGVYEKAIKEIESGIDIFTMACPLFVPLVEEGWWEKDITYRIVEEYLGSLKDKQIDTLVMGCTHYPLLEKVIKTVMGDNIVLVNSAREVARTVKDFLDKHELRSENTHQPEYRFYTSDSVDKFKSLGGLFIGREIDVAQRVDIEKY